MRRNLSVFMILLASSFPAVAGGPDFLADITTTSGDADIELIDNSANETDWELCLDNTGCNATGTDGVNEAFHIKWVDGASPQIPFVIETATNNYTLYVDAAERIGIGTSTPGFELTIPSSSPEISLDDTSIGAGEAFIEMSGNTLTIEGIGGVDVIEFDVRAPVTMDIDDTGNTVFFGDLQVNSSREAKRSLEEVDGGEILSRLRELPIHRWSYKKDGESIRHLGPMAEDFHAAFGLGQTDKHISVIDSAGVALTAAQALALRVEALEAENLRLRDELTRLRTSVATSDSLLELERRLARLEASRTAAMTSP